MYVLWCSFSYIVSVGRRQCCTLCGTTSFRTGIIGSFLFKLTFLMAFANVCTANLPMGEQILTSGNMGFLPKQFLLLQSGLVYSLFMHHNLSSTCFSPSSPPPDSVLSDPGSRGPSSLLWLSL